MKRNIVFCLIFSSLLCLVTISSYSGLFAQKNIAMAATYSEERRNDEYPPEVDEWTRNYLAKQKAEQEKQGKLTWEKFEELVKSGSVNELENALKSDKDFLNSKDKDLYTPLKAAIKMNASLAIIKCILNNGADTNAEGIDNPLMYALLIGKIDIGAFIIDSGADIDVSLKAIQGIYGKDNQIYEMLQAYKAMKSASKASKEGYGPAILGKNLRIGTVLSGKISLGGLMRFLNMKNIKAS